jgi:hypothetical protein
MRKQRFSRAPTAARGSRSKAELMYAEVGSAREPFASGSPSPGVTRPEVGRSLSRLGTDRTEADHDEPTMTAEEANEANEAIDKAELGSMWSNGQSRKGSDQSRTRSPNHGSFMEASGPARRSSPTLTPARIAREHWARRTRPRSTDPRPDLSAGDRRFESGWGYYFVASSGRIRGIRSRVGNCVELSHGSAMEGVACATAPRCRSTC